MIKWMLVSFDIIASSKVLEVTVAIPLYIYTYYIPGSDREQNTSWTQPITFLSLEAEEQRSDLSKALHEESLRLRVLQV